MLKKILLYISLLIAGSGIAQEIIAARGQRHAAASYLSQTNLYRIGGHTLFNPFVFQRFPLTVKGTPDRRIINTGRFLEDFSLYSPGIAVHGKYLYIVTGSLMDRRGKLSPLPHMIRYTFDAKGDLTEQKKLGPLPEPDIAGSGVLVSGKYILVIGGYFKRNCYAAELLADGTIGAWKKLRPIPSNVTADKHVVKTGNKLYVCGSGGHNHRNNKMYMTGLDEEGLPTRWRRINAMPVNVSSNSCLVAENEKSMLFFDGNDNKVYRATFDEDGDVKEWKLVPGAKIPGGSKFLHFDIKRLANGKWLLVNALQDKPRRFLPATMFEIPETK